jgi:hypothetical protein
MIEINQLLCRQRNPASLNLIVGRSMTPSPSRVLSLLLVAAAYVRACWIPSELRVVESQATISSV